MATWSTLLGSPTTVASASADSCPDVEVTFARATSEAPGIGVVGGQCAPGDPVCTPGAMFTVPTHDELSSPAHLSYPNSGMPAQAATFVASHL